MRRGRVIVASGGVALALSLVGCGNGPPAAGGSAPGPPPGKGGDNLGTANVTVASTDQNTFSPASSTLKVGDIIKWTNTGQVVHNVTFEAYEPLSHDLSPGVVWEVSFDKPGSYDYHCTIHPNMTAKLTVS